MGHEEVWRCKICGHLEVFYVMSDSIHKNGDEMFNYCSNGCVYNDDPHCVIKGKSKFVKVFG